MRVRNVDILVDLCQTVYFWGARRGKGARGQGGKGVKRSAKSSSWPGDATVPTPSFFPGGKGIPF